MSVNEDAFTKILRAYQKEFQPTVRFNHFTEKIVSFDLSENNIELGNVNTENVVEFSKYILGKLKKQKAKFGFGGYTELRAFYSRSHLFDGNLLNRSVLSAEEEPRRLHIGVDIWGEAGTAVYAPLEGMVHSFAFNNNFGDYGATIILMHQLEGVYFYTLYGHLSEADIKDLKKGIHINFGQKLAHFGKPAENGNWPPHLHFQIIKNISVFKGDYPGVCKLSEGKQYLENSPDPDLILKMREFIAR